MKIGIIGNGFVGKATYLLKCSSVNILAYDINPDYCMPKGTTLEDICNCDLIFISVPTPMNKDGSYYLNIVENVINDLKKFINFDEKCVVLRSTVTPGISDNLNCFFMPEFLTEKNYENDFKRNPHWIFGLKQNTKQNEKFKYLINNLINSSYLEQCIYSNKIIYLDNKEAEMIKLFRNNFLAVKVSFCNEIYKYCDKKNISYETVRKYATLDTRINDSHSKVPGHDGCFGYGGTCFPKDTHGLLFDMEKNDVKSCIIKGAIERNEQIDRCEKDWESNKGRAVI